MGAEVSVAAAAEVVVGGLQLNVIVEGEGQPLLVISGIGANVEMCEPFARALKQVRLIMFDMPGCGASSTPARPMSFAGLASLIEELLDELGYERVDVLGVSMGGGVAQQLARQAPHRVRRLVLVATGRGIGMVPGRWSAPGSEDTLICPGKTGVGMLGVLGREDSQMPRSYPLEVRRQVIELARAGTRVSQLSVTFGMTEATIYNWLKQDRVDRGEVPGLSTEQQLDLAAARRRIRQLETELAVARKVNEVFLREGISPKGSTR